jgi:hypothetical protein
VPRHAAAELLVWQERVDPELLEHVGEVAPPGQRDDPPEHLTGVGQRD